MPPMTVTSLDLQHQLDINYYLTLSAFTLLVYEYTLTFAYEVERFWKWRTLTWAAFFFYLNRYLTLFGHIPIVVEYFWATTSHHKLQSYHQYFAIVVQIMVAILLIMRMYALYDRNIRILGLFVGVALGAVAFGCWAVLSGKGGSKPVDYLLPVGCSATLTRSAALRLGAAWGGMLVFDTLVFVLTLYRSLTLRRASGLPLLGVLMRDGSLYFGVMVGVNLGNIMTFVFGGNLIRGVGTTMTNVISSILISRLMLNLRDPNLAFRSYDRHKRQPLIHPTSRLWPWNSSSPESSSRTTASQPIVSTLIDPRGGAETSNSLEEANANGSQWNWSSTLDGGWGTVEVVPHRTVVSVNSGSPETEGRSGPSRGGGGGGGGDDV